MSAIGVQAQDTERYTYYLVSDSIFEASSYTYIERDSVDTYGFIPLTGDDQFIQITNKPVYVVCYDAVADSAFYLYAHSAAYNIDENTGEPVLWMGEWNPSSYNKANNKGWKNVKNASFPYMYLWWSMENSHEEKYYSFSDLVSGMYYVKLEKETMKTGYNSNDAVISFFKMDDLNPITPVWNYPIIQIYEYTKHTQTSYASSSSGSGYSKYGSLYNYNAFTMMYSLAHGSSSRGSSSTSTYYTWDSKEKKYLSKYSFMDSGYFEGYYTCYVEGVYEKNKAVVLYLPKDNTAYGVKKTNVYSDRFETYWYELVPYNSTDRNWYCPESIPEKSMELIIDVENKRVCAVPSTFFSTYYYAKDYDDLKWYIDRYYLNYEIQGNESMPLTIGDVDLFITVYDKVYDDPEGAKELREYALGDMNKNYEMIIKFIDWFYLHYSPVGHGCPPMTEEKIKKIIDEYGEYYNDEAGAAELRKYAFGDTGVDDITIDVQDNNPYYNLQGLPVNVDQLEKFKIYIHNGKKYMER
ncbi:MAG: hypothetical protein MJZ37_10085 [Bacilli bacterium]|nr:hypothetical protein [Bacilli bacterium]